MSDPKSPENKAGSVKRKLRLMNEVLPAPAPLGSKSVRERTISRMQNLVGAAAALGITVSACKPGGSSGANAGTSGGDSGSAGNTSGATDASTSDASDAAVTNDASMNDAGDAGAQDGGADASDGGKKKKAQNRALPPRTDPGYMVVDMLPPPPPRQPTPLSPSGVPLHKIDNPIDDRSE